MKFKQSIEIRVKTAMFKSICILLERKPKSNILKIFKLIKALAKDEYNKNVITNIEKCYEEIPSVKEFIENTLTTVNHNFLKKFIFNFINNNITSESLKIARNLQNTNIAVPFTIIINPCNNYCNANEISSSNLNFSQIDELIKEAKTFGIYNIIIAGEEPFLIEYLYEIYKKYNDIIFATITTKTVFTKEIATKLLDLGNVIPVLSLQAFEEETDLKYGKNTFKKIMEGMTLLKHYKIPFGAHSVVSTHNMNTVTSDKFIDMLIEHGSKFNIYSMPFDEISLNNSNDSNSTQFTALKEKVEKIRMTKPYFIIDLFNDSLFIKDCFSGKYYNSMHLNHKTQSCASDYISAENIKSISLWMHLNIMQYNN